MSLRIRFLLLIGILSLLATMCIAYASYQFSLKNAMNEAKNKGQLVFNFLDSSKDFFREHQWPQALKIIPRGRFIPELQSGFTLTRGVANEFHKKNPDYVFKQATIDPLHLDNKADEDDLKIIDTFKKQPDKKFDEGTILKNGQTYYFFAQPVKIQMKKCLRCHGDPATAPKEQIEIYGSNHGYNWKLGEITSVDIVYVPLQKALDQAKQGAVNLVMIGVGGILVMMLLLWIFFSMFVIKPVSTLKQRATEISLGKNLSDPIRSSSKDEIGSLARAVDRLRISVDKMLQHFKK